MTRGTPIAEHPKDEAWHHRSAEGIAGTSGFLSDRTVCAGCVAMNTELGRIAGLIEEAVRKSAHRFSRNSIRSGASSSGRR